MTSLAPGLAPATCEESGTVARTVPYPWPYDGGLDARGLALVVCGAQRRFVAAAHGAATVAVGIGELAETVRTAGGAVVWVRHGTRAGVARVPSPLRKTRPTWLPERDTEGWAIDHDVVDGGLAAGDVVIDTAGWDGCFGSDLDVTLRAAGARWVALAGFASEVTVDSTVRTLNDRGHECLVLHDLCAPVDVELGARALRSLTMSGGIFGAHGASSDLVAALTSNDPSDEPTDDFRREHP
jgi:nicotinamidase-related amidase